MPTNVSLDDVIANIAKVVAGLQVPLSMPGSARFFGAAHEPYRELLGALGPGFGWTNDEEVERNLRALLTAPRTTDRGDEDDHIMDRLAILLADSITGDDLYRLGVEDPDVGPFPIEAEPELDCSDLGNPINYVRLTVSDRTYVAVLHAGDVPPR